MKINEPMVDYVTLTSWHESAFDLWRWWTPEGKDCKRKGVRPQGYEGVMVSCSIGSMFVGVGKQVHPVDKKTYPHYMARVSGEMANDFYLWHEKVVYPFAPEQKRIDVQVTVPHPEGYDALKMYEEIKSELVRCGRQDTIRLIASGLGKTKGMDTLYLGARERAERMVRVYRKDDTEGGKYLRFEVEMKEGKAATFRYELLHGDILDALRRRVPLAIRHKSGSLWEMIAKCLVPGEVKRKQVTNKERDTLLWLEKSVRPAIMRAYNDHQYRGMIELWLDDLISSLPTDEV